MENRSRVIACIIGVEVNNNKVLRVLECKVTEDKERVNSQTGMIWEYKPLRMDRDALVRYINSGKKVLNAAVADGNQLYGSTGSLDRFGKGAEYTILSKIVREKDDTTIGYRVAHSSGKVYKMTAGDLIGMCRKAYGSGKILVQNAIYVSKSNEQKEHLREYVENSIIKEYLYTKPIENKEVKVAAAKITRDNFSDEQKKVLTEAKKAGVKMGILANPKLSPDCMKFYLTEIKNGCDIRQYYNPEYSLGQLMILSTAYEEGIDLEKIKNPKMSVNEMTEIYERLRNGMWSIDYETDIMNIGVTK